MKTPSKRRFYQQVEPELYPITKSFARANRKTPTAAEECLWRHLRNRQLDGFKFRTQHPIGPYVVDFLCFAGKLIVEADGGIHTEGNHPNQDERRTKDLEKMGFVIIRFTNERILLDTASVLEEIRQLLRQRSGS